MNRRQFLKTAIAGATAGACSRLWPAPAVLSERSPGSKLAVAVIGCGERGATFHIPAAAEERLVAIVDCDENRLRLVARPPKAQRPAGDEKRARGVDFARVAKFTDYRRMFEKMGKGIDAVFIATPNHHHATAALIAMQLGKHVYCEKPLCHDIAQARRMAEAAAKYKVATQMGNQGHSSEGIRRVCEYIWAGALGKVTEVHTWSNRCNGGIGPRPPTEPVPPGLHWEEWIGPAPYRDYHKLLHPHKWHGWYDFGNGSLGNMGCHILDGAVWALHLDKPTAVEAEELWGGSEERYPLGARIRWDFPARGDMPPLKLYWYDGKKKSDKSLRDTSENTLGYVPRPIQNLPPLVEELERRYKINLGDNGALYVGEKAILWSDTTCSSVRIIPEKQHRATPIPAVQIPRIKGSHADDFLAACRSGTQPCSPFSYAARLTEIVLLGALAYIAGAGRRIEWDAAALRCPNAADLDRWIRCPVRKGWEI